VVAPIVSSRQGLAGSRLTVAVVALAFAVAVSTSACSGQTQAATHSSGSAPGAGATRPSGEKAQLRRSVPVRLQIPAIGVDTRLVALGLQADGTMEVPSSGFPAGWYTGAPTPGEQGPAVIAGHVDWNGPGVFYELRKLRPGDQVSVTRADGSMPVFRVSLVRRFPKDHFPTNEVYGDIDHAALRLITCGGSFNSRLGHYDDDIIAFADLLPSARRT
jgi:LPXTG-site transpeptidase (sortase) family protein